ncbi:MAG TPA: hypothetical protein VED83_07015, partial [Burkholderiaceae bacterium]|nr:hypothetical protein [Burkholderiaceae bacterium]
MIGARIAFFGRAARGSLVQIKLLVFLGTLWPLLLFEAQEGRRPAAVRSSWGLVRNHYVGAPS